ncbi:UPF0215 protein, partial [Dissostichus eleginoides]
RRARGAAMPPTLFWKEFNYYILIKTQRNDPLLSSIAAEHSPGLSSRSLLPRSAWQTTDVDTKRQAKP